MATPPIEDWAHLPWRKLERVVYRLQTRIFRASERGNVQVVRSLQRLWMKSEPPRWRQSAGHPGQPGERTRPRSVGKARPTRAPSWSPPWSARRDKPQTRRSGSQAGQDGAAAVRHPVMLDRAHQALVKLALEPEWEARFEPNSYGFRQRSVHDAIGALFGMLSHKDKYVLDADIQGCFDNARTLPSSTNWPPIRP